MKKLLILVIMLIVMVTSVSAIDYNNFETYITFDNYSNGAFQDEFGNNQLTLFGGSKSSVTGVYGDSVDVNIGNYVTQNMNYLYGQPTTVGFWVHTPNSWGYFMTSGINSLDNPRTVVLGRDDLGYMNINDVGEQTFNLYVGASSWNHYTMVFDGDSVDIYYDGNPAQDVYTDEFYTNFAIDHNPFMNGDSFNSYTNFGDVSGATLSNQFLIDDYFIYNGALTESEVNEIINGGFSYVQTLENTAPSVDVISPNGVLFSDIQSQLFTMIYTDDDGDGIISWEVDSSVVSGETSSTITIDGDDYSVGSHILRGIVDDGTYSDYIDVTFEITASNTEPIIESISPSERTEIKQGESITYISLVTDTDGDAIYNWTLGGIEVSTESTYTANWEDIEPGVYTIQLEVSDAEYSNTESSILEIRALGGSSSSFSVTAMAINDIAVQTNSPTSEKISPIEVTASQSFFQSISDFFSSIMEWFK